MTILNGILNMKTNHLIYFFLLFLSINSQIFAADAYSVVGSGNTSIDITTTQSSLQVASLSAVDTSNSSKLTYNVTVASQNGGLLNSTAKNKGGSASTYLKTYKIGFTLSNGTNLTPASPLLDTATIGTTATNLFSAKEANNTVGVTGNLTFSITGTSSSQLYSGTYSDVLAVTFSRTGGTTQTINLNLTATVIADSVTISITPTASASNLPLTSTQSGLNVGAINVIANCQNGYTLSVSSTNSGQLVNTSIASPGINDKISYSLSFGGSNLTLSSTPTIFSTVNTATMMSTATSVGSLLMSYTGVSTSSRSAGTYKDVLTFTLSAQ
jgi:hypothetical protein